MMDITKLADEWRNDEAGFQAVTHDKRLSCHNGLTCATELAAVLPKWALITDDPTTWPAVGQEVLIADWIDGWRLFNTVGGLNEPHWHSPQIGDLWRPLCDLDYPPGEQP